MRPISLVMTATELPAHGQKRSPWTEESQQIQHLRRPLTGKGGSLRSRFVGIDGIMHTTFVDAAVTEAHQHGTHGISEVIHETRTCQTAPQRIDTANSVGHHLEKIVVYPAALSSTSQPTAHCAVSGAKFFPFVRRLCALPPITEPGRPHDNATGAKGPATTKYLPKHEKLCDLLAETAEPRYSPGVRRAPSLFLLGALADMHARSLFPLAHYRK